MRLHETTPGPPDPAIERLPFGGSIVLRNRLSRAVVLSNEAGAQILDRFLSGWTARDIAAEVSERPEDIPDLAAVIQATLDQWQVAGLLSDRAITDHYPSEPPPDRDALGAIFASGARRMRLTSDSVPLFGQIATLLSDYRVFDADGGPEGHIRIAHVGNDVAVFQDGRPLWRAATPDEARFLALQALIAGLAGGDEIAAILHAGLLVREGRGLLLAGDTGRGKTTLTLALSEAGWSFAGDDLIALHREGHAIALPLGAHLKRTDDVTRRAGNRVLQWCGTPGGLVWPEERATPGTPIPVHGLLFPQFMPGAPPRREARTPEEALKRLITTGTEPVGPLNTLSAVTALLGRAPAATITYGASEEALTLVETHVATW